MLQPSLEEKAEEHSELVLKVVDVDENREAPEAARIRALPTFKVYKNGAEVAEHLGAGAVNNAIISAKE